jgi:hypothetical protein
MLKINTARDDSDLVGRHAEKRELTYRVSMGGHDAVGSVGHRRFNLDPVVWARLR